jgi:thiol:disulfide interchange protein
VAQRTRQSRRGGESLRLGSNPSPGARRIIVFAGLLFFSFTVPPLHAASSSWQSNPQGRVRVLSADNTVPPKGTLLLGLHFQPTSGWYYYWKLPGEAGIPPKIVWKASKGISNPQLLFPAPMRIVLPGDITEFGYLGETVYPVQAKLTGGPVHLEAQVSYLTCNTSCIPFKYTFILDLAASAQESVDAESDALIRAALAKVPPASVSDAQIQKDAPVVNLNPGESQAPAASGSASLLGILLVAFLGGILLNVMPCVLPVLSIKLLGLLQHGGQSRLIIARDALASAAGILISFFAMGLAAIIAKGAGHAVGWGIQFQQPLFVGLLAVVMTFFALNLWGVFEIQLPHVVGRLGAVNSEDEGMGSFFVSGLLATLLATPCSAPFLGTALGFALVQPPAVILLIFSVVGAGLSLPYFVLAVFPGAIQWLPRPGTWMIRLKQGMGFLLAATAAWLFMVLSRQVTFNALVFFLLALMGISFLIWVREALSEKNRYTAGAAILFWIMTAGILGGALTLVATHRVSDSSHESLVAGGLSWVPFNEAEIQRQAAMGKRVFVDVTADWCVTCKVNEKTVLQRGEVAKALASPDLVLMRADWTNNDPAITQFLQKYGRAGIPFYVLFRPGRDPVLLSEFLTQRQVLKAFAS